MLLNGNYGFDETEHQGYRWIEEFVGTDWHDCVKKINKKYFNLKS